MSKKYYVHYNCSAEKRTRQMRRKRDVERRDPRKQASYTQTRMSYVNHRHEVKQAYPSAELSWSTNTLRQVSSLSRIINELDGSA